jgi:hypothetical protein
MYTKLKLFFSNNKLKYSKELPAIQWNDQFSSSLHFFLMILYNTFYFLKGKNEDMVQNTGIGCRNCNGNLKLVIG